MVQVTPKGFHSVTPFFMASDPDKFVEFLKKGVGAQVVSELRGQNGKIMHAQIKIGDSMIMLGDAMGNKTDPMAMYIYLDKPDEAYQRALDAGATSITEPSDQFYGDRNAGVKDPFGNTWWFARHIEDVADDEMKKRAREFEKKQKAA
jgi:PhnB protein